MQLNKEQQAKVFGLHIGSKVYDMAEKVAGTLVGMYLRINTLYLRYESNLKGGIMSIPMERCQLILTPLSEITDEDAAMVASIYYGGTRSWQQGKGILRRFLESGLLVNLKTVTNILGYLRSKSYHVPYMGYDLYEAGIAIKPEEVK